MHCPSGPILVVSVGFADLSNSNGIGLIAVLLPYCWYLYVFTILKDASNNMKSILNCMQKLLHVYINKICQDFMDVWM